ncbi:MCE family protein [Aeromicrobium terrae]|uniref:MCE family protein n=1 Tax=Aeromicrobium terrae TaxID=2498846 RepID=A0A5C8NJZ2_9ACTN|nr:MCE family protein [Aeromicrobium terrae]TXL60763.1 MCE family protein [Aeromicrobium terrae]
MTNVTTWIRDHVMLAASAGVALLLLVAFVIFPGNGSRTLTAHFDRAVAVYPGTELRVMGVRIGEVTDVVPDGNSVRVVMKYDAQYKLPAGAKAAVVTPTLIADRYVQVFPAYGSGPVMADGADIPLDRTNTPIELDRMYKAINDLSTTLGPKAGSTRGALDALLTAGAKALDGNGKLGSETIRNLSAAANTFSRNRGPLFDNVSQLAEITQTLAANDTTVQQFMESLTSVSGQLAGEKDEIAKVLEALGDVLGSVKGFVHDNRADLKTDIDLLNSLLKRVDRQKDNLGLVVEKGSLALGNLGLAFDPSTGSFGSRLQVAPGILFRPDQFLCQTLVNSGAPESVCKILSTLLEPLLPITAPIASKAVGTGVTKPDASTPTPAPSGGTPSDGPRSLLSLLGGGLG